jgi:hypothetical protein
VTPRREGEQLDVDLVDAALDRAVVTTQLEEALVAEYARTFAVDCGGTGVVVAEVGATLTCTATDDDGRRQVTATVEDAGGTLSFDVGG